MEEILERLERIQGLMLLQPDRFTIKNSDQIFELLGKNTAGVNIMENASVVEKHCIKRSKMA